MFLSCPVSPCGMSCAITYTFIGGNRAHKLWHSSKNHNDCSFKIWDEIAGKHLVLAFSVREHSYSDSQGNESVSRVNSTITPFAWDYRLGLISPNLIPLPNSKHFVNEYIEWYKIRIPSEGNVLLKWDCLCKNVQLVILTVTQTEKMEILRCSFVIFKLCRWLHKIAAPFHRSQRNKFRCLLTPWLIRSLFFHCYFFCTSFSTFKSFSSLIEGALWEQAPSYPTKKKVSFTQSQRLMGCRDNNAPSGGRLLCVFERRRHSLFENTYS